MSQSTDSYNLIRPLSVGNIANIALFIYRSHFKLYVGLALKANLWILPVFVVAAVGALVLKSSSAKNSAFWILLLIIIGIIAFIYGWAKFLAASALISRLVFNELTGQSESIKNAKKQLTSKIWPFLATAIIVILILFVAATILIIGLLILWFIIFLGIGLLQISITNINGIQNQSILIIIGFISILLIIATFIAFLAGLLWVYSRFLIAEVPLAIERNMNTGSTIGRSWQLTRKSVARIQGVITIVSLITLPIQLPIQIFSILLQKSNGFLYQLLYTLIVVALGLLVGAFILPFWQAVKGVIYYDLRVRQEGLGLQQRLRRESEQEDSTIEL